MEIIINIFSWLFSHILELGLGGLIAWYIEEPQRIPKWIDLNKRTNWKGEWFCAWYPELPTDNSWVKEDTVLLSHKLGKLHIKSHVSTLGYYWEAKLSIKGLFLIGEWKSLKLNSTSQGTMQLKISNQGNTIYGIATGPHIDNKLVTFKFVFSDSKEDFNSTIEKFDKLI